MTATEITELINKELEAEPNIRNVFGLDMTICLVSPIKQMYKDSNDSSESYELWTVLEEREDKNGYKIYYDEDINLFGLAVKSDKEELIAIGDYGGFLKTLYSM